MAQKYKMKPVVVEAMRWTGTPQSATEVIDWVLSCDSHTSIRYHAAQDAYDDGEQGCPYSPAFLAVDTLGGTVHAEAGDFIARDMDGEFRPCRGSEFSREFEPVAA